MSLNVTWGSLLNTEQIADIRTFNRFYTRIIGLLEEGMHSSPYTLIEARVVHEIGKRGNATASAIAAELNMDRGQMSRLVRRLVDHGLVSILPADDDKRSAPLALTPQGNTVYAQLNELSDAAAMALIEPLDEFKRRDLVGAMRRIGVLLGRPIADDLVLRAPRIGEIGWLIHRQGLLYHLEQGWNGEFEALIAQLYGEFAAVPDTATKALWVAEQGGEVAGSVYIVPAAATEPEGTAQLRMLYVEPAFRGRGIAKRLVAEALAFSRAAGYRRVILWTQDCLSSARSIYQKAGFSLVREEAHHSFGVDLNGQYWARDL
jgi:DNA-binding MarR family transcriptional regulator/ribosomal protein S18 acetylase RimI-like enzyme